MNFYRKAFYFPLFLFLFTITNVWGETIINNADDLCYEEAQYDGLMCIDMGICGGGVGCKNTYPLKNIGDANLTDVHVDYNETGMMQGSFSSNCGVDDANGEAGSCTQQSKIDMGPFGVMDKGTHFNLDNTLVPEDDQNKIWAKNFMSGSCFSGEKLYATYLKKGVRYRGEIHQCGAVASEDYPCSKPHKFELRTNYILPGDLVAIGNSNICADKDKNGICDANQKQRNDVTNIIFINSHSSSAIDAGLEPDGVENISSAKLSLPKGATVVWAGLYWQGEVWDINKANKKRLALDGKTPIENGNDGQQRKKLANTIQFKTPNGTYKKIVADEHYYFFVKRQNGYRDGYKGIPRYEEHYQSFKDVTNLVQKAGNGDYWVANIQATPGHLWYPGVEAAWTLQVIYEFQDAPPRSIAINDGYFGLYDSSKDGDKYATEVNKLNNNNACKTGGEHTGAYGRSISFKIGGFLTPKAPGFTTDMTLFLTESDPGSSTGSQENLTITKKDGSISKVDGPDAWNYEILDKNGSNNLRREPHYIYPIGMTIKNYRMTDGLSTEQTSTTVKFQTGSDRLMLGVIGFATDLRKPRLCYDYAYSQYGQYFTKDYNQTKGPYLEGYIHSGVPVDVKLYIKNEENSDLTADDVKINILDINTTQAHYKSSSTKISYYKSLEKTSISDSDLQIADNKSYVQNIPIGKVKGLEYFYTYYSLDTKTAHLDMPIKARVDYNLTLPIGNDESITIPYRVYLNSGIPMCSNANFQYAPVKGIFNIVHHDYYDADQGGSKHYYNLPTQVTQRVGNFKVLSMDPKHLDTLKGTSTIVAVDMIDASAFHDTNASCTELSSRISPRVWVTLEDNATSTLFDQTVVKANFYKEARRNAAFRISYNTTVDGNNSLVKISKNNSLYNIDNYSKVVGSLTECPNSRMGTVSHNCHNGQGLNKGELTACMECLYGGNTHLICSRDNFAIRPEAFEMQLKDQNQTNATQRVAISSLHNSGSANAIEPHFNLAAGYAYNLEVNATNHIDNNSSLGYTRYSNLPESLSAAYRWNPQGHIVNGCNAATDVNISIEFLNGNVDTNTTLSNVGSYRLNLIDKYWTVVDYDPKYMTHHKGSYFENTLDCRTNSDIVLNTGRTMEPKINSDLSILNGCTISSHHLNTEANNGSGIQYNDYNITFHPYKFDMSSITPTVGPDNRAISTNSYIYYTDMNNNIDEKMSYHLNGSIAAYGYNNVALSNFVSQCYATPLDLNITTTMSRDLNNSKGDVAPYQVRFHDNNASGVRQSALDVNTSDLHPAQDLDIAITPVHFLKKSKGIMNTELNLNYQRAKNRTMNPIGINFVRYQANCTNAATDCTFKADLTTKHTHGQKDLNASLTIRHYYGRTHIPRQRFVGKDGNATIYYEVYCADGGIKCNKKLLQDGLTSKTSDDSRWFINSKHTAAFGLPGDVNQKTYSVGRGYVVQQKAATGNAVVNGKYDYVSLHYNGERGFPYKTTIENNASDWLLYDPYNAAVQKNESDVEFSNGESDWAGKRATDTATKRNASDQTNRRTMW